MGSLQKLRRKNIQILPRALDKTSVLATFGSIGHSHTRFSANELWVALRIPWSLMYQLAASLMQANEFKKRIALSAEFCSRAYFHWHLRNWVTEWMRHALRNSILMIKRDAWRNSNTNSYKFCGLLWSLIVTAFPWIYCCYKDDNNRFSPPTMNSRGAVKQSELIKAKLFEISSWKDVFVLKFHDKHRDYMLSIDIHVDFFTFRVTASFSMISRK